MLTLRLAAMFVVLVAGCSGPSSANGESPGASSPVDSATPKAPCSETTRVRPDGAMRGQTENGQVWALGGAPKVGEEFKLVLRVTGAGELSVLGVSPDGSRRAPTSVVEHISSNFNRPGDEWGTFWKFDRVGCWRIIVQRGNLNSNITLTVDE